MAKKKGRGLDRVGQEDADVNNNGVNNDPSDQYIMNRRKAISRAMGEDSSQNLFVDRVMTRVEERFNESRLTDFELSIFESILASRFMDVRESVLEDMPSLNESLDEDTLDLVTEESVIDELIEIFEEQLVEDGYNDEYSDERMDELLGQMLTNFAAGKGFRTDRGVEKRTQDRMKKNPEYRRSQTLRRLKKKGYSPSAQDRTTPEFRKKLRRHAEGGKLPKEMGRKRPDGSELQIAGKQRAGKGRAGTRSGRLHPLERARDKAFAQTTRSKSAADEAPVKKAAEAPVKKAPVKKAPVKKTAEAPAPQDSNNGGDGGGEAKPKPKRQRKSTKGLTKIMKHIKGRDEERKERGEVAPRVVVGSDIGKKMPRPSSRRVRAGAIKSMFDANKKTQDKMKQGKDKPEASKPEARKPMVSRRNVDRAYMSAQKKGKLGFGRKASAENASTEIIRGARLGLAERVLSTMLSEEERSQTVMHPSGKTTKVTPEQVRMRRIAAERNKLSNPKRPRINPQEQ